jgi:hypothetical protein
MNSEPHELRKLYLERNRNESRLAVERLKGLLTFHGFLFAAVGIVAAKKLVAVAIILFVRGALICLPWYCVARLSYWRSGPA